MITMEILKLTISSKTKARKNETETNDPYENEDTQLDEDYNWDDN